MILNYWQHPTNQALSSIRDWLILFPSPLLSSPIHYCPIWFDLPLSLILFMFGGSACNFFLFNSIFVLSNAKIPVYLVILWKSRSYYTFWSCTYPSCKEYFLSLPLHERSIYFKGDLAKKRNFLVQFTMVRPKGSKGSVLSKLGLRLQVVEKPRSIRSPQPQNEVLAHLLPALNATSRCNNRFSNFVQSSYELG